MSLLSILGKIGKGALNVGTGGISGTVLDALGKGGSAAGAAGSVMGGQQAGKNNALIAQGQLNQGQDRNAIDLYQAQQGAQNSAAQQDLQRKGFESANRSTSAKQALIGALLGGGVTPTSINGGSSSGGLLRSLNGNPDALAAMKLLGSQGSQAQQTPLAFQGGNQMLAPSLSAVPKIDTGGGTMGTLAKIAQIFGAIAPYMHKGGGGGSDASMAGGAD